MSAIEIDHSQVDAWVAGGFVRDHGDRALAVIVRVLRGKLAEMPLDAAEVALLRACVAEAARRGLASEEAA